MMNDRDDISLHMETISKFASQCTDIVEIGPEFGNGSTRAIAAGIYRKEYPLNAGWVTVDIVDHIIPECRPTHPGWSMVVGDSRETSTLLDVDSIIPVADLIFIDTIHEKEFLAKELSVWVNIAWDGTVWLFHDTWMMGSYNRMTDAIKEFAQANPQWKYVDISRKCNGLGALIPADKELADYGVESY